MRNVWLVVRREYLERVRTKSFIISTILTPLLLFCFAVVPSLLMSRKTSGQRSVVVAASSQAIADAVKAELENQPANTETSSSPDAPEIGRREAGPLPPQTEDEEKILYRVQTSTDVSEAEKQRLVKAVDAQEIDGFLWLTDEAVAKNSVLYAGRSVSDFVEMAGIRTAVRQGIAKQRLAAHGISDAEAQQLLQRVELDAFAVKNGAISEADGMVMFLSSFFLVLGLYMMLILYGVAVMRSVMEEKTSRIVEVMLSSLTAKQMLTGKIIGVAAVGFTQTSIWMALAAVASAPGLAALPKGVNISPFALVCFVIFFLLGYLLYSSVFAAVGAMCNSDQEAQQLQTIAMSPLIIAIMLVMLVMKQPNSTEAVVLSFVPFFSPMLMYLRVVVQQPPLWQIGLSMALLVATIYVMLALTSRIYRVGILMYGKRPTLPEIVKWIKYAG
jgi:ABC-2 type transport system permease protein